jgi:SdpC family antimicrobial peptide
MLKQPLAIARVLGIALTTVIGMTGCGNGKPQGIAEHFSGQALYNGIYFGEGRVGSMLPEIWHGSSISGRAADPKTANLIKAREQVTLERLERQKPGFFVGFQKAVTSGDQIQVGSALDLGARLLQGTNNRQQRDSINPEDEIVLDVDAIVPPTIDLGVDLAAQFIVPPMMDVDVQQAIDMQQAQDAQRVVEIQQAGDQAIVADLDSMIYIIDTGIILATENANELRVTAKEPHRRDTVINLVTQRFENH